MGEWWDKDMAWKFSLAESKKKYNNKRQHSEAIGTVGFESEKSLYSKTNGWVALKYMQEERLKFFNSLFQKIALEVAWPIWFLYSS